MQKSTTKKQKNRYNTIKQAGATTTHSSCKPNTFILYQTTTMKKRNLVRATLATKDGTPLSKGNEFKDRPAAAKCIEEMRNKGEAIQDGLMGRDEYNHIRYPVRTHETSNNTIMETYTKTDTLGNKRYLYLERKPTTELLEMRQNG